MVPYKLRRDWSGTTPIFKILCSTIYSLQFSSRTQMLFGWCGVLFIAPLMAAFQHSRHFQVSFSPELFLCGPYHNTPCPTSHIPIPHPVSPPIFHLPYPTPVPPLLSHLSSPTQPISIEHCVPTLWQGVCTIP